MFNDTKSVAEYFAEFDKIAYDKIKKRRGKYGELVPVPGAYENLCDHMLEEFAEWMCAEYGPDGVIEAVVILLEKLHKSSKIYNKHDAEENIVEELADVYNMARIMYMCGKAGGDI